MAVGGGKRPRELGEHTGIPLFAHTAKVQRAARQEGEEGGVHGRQPLHLVPAPYAAANQLLGQLHAARASRAAVPAPLSVRVRCTVPPAEYVHAVWRDAPTMQSSTAAAAATPGSRKSRRFAGVALGAANQAWPQQGPEGSRVNAPTEKHTHICDSGAVELQPRPPGRGRKRHREDRVG